MKSVIGLAVLLAVAATTPVGAQASKANGKFAVKGELLHTGRPPSSDILALS
jgi:hypothetical protein